MEEFIKSQEQPKRSPLLRFLTAIGIAAILVESCNPPSITEAEGKLSDAQSQTLDIGDNQRDINKEGLGYVQHYGKGDDYQISKLDRQTARRARRNERRYNRGIGKIGRAERRLDDAICAGTETESTKQKRVKKSGHNYDPHQFENSNDAIRKEIERRERESKK